MQPLIRTFDDHAPPGVRHVVEASRILSVAEPEIFRLAYRYYYDRHLSESFLDELFGGYLNEQELPGWVRAYCSKVLQAADCGRLVPKDFGVERPDTGRNWDQQFASMITLIGFLFYLIVFA